MATIPFVEGLQTPAVAAPAQATAPNVEQLKTVAAQFEALLLGQMMKQMRASMLDENDKESGFGGGPLSDALYSELSLSLSRAGGVGLGRAMTEAIARREGESGGLSGAAAVFSLPDAAAVPGSGMPAMPGIPGMTTPSAAPSMLQPSGRVSSNYGWRNDPIDGQSKFHKGTDIAMPLGQEVPAAMAGTVAFAGELSGYGLTVVVDHGRGLETRYAHLSSASVGQGDVVAQGQTIAKSGSSGRSTGPHLHFEVLESGQPVDPSGVFGLAKQH